MSNLDYPISVLQAEREKICNCLASTGDNQLQKEAQFDEVNKAIKILIAEKMRNELGIIPEKLADKLLKDTMGKLEKEGIVKKE